MDQEMGKERNSALGRIGSIDCNEMAFTNRTAGDFSHLGSICILLHKMVQMKVR